MNAPVRADPGALLAKSGMRVLFVPSVSFAVQMEPHARFEFRRGVRAAVAGFHGFSAKPECSMPCASVVAERADGGDIEAQVTRAVRCDVVFPADEKPRRRAQPRGVFRVFRVLALLAKMDECARDLDEALEKIAVAVARAEPEHVRAHRAPRSIRTR